MHRTLKKTLFAAASATAAITLTGGAVAFCGFYVAKADTKLFNKASKVAIMRDNNRTVITMANDYQGDLKEFAMVIPVPVVLQEEQIHVTDNAIIDHLDAYTSPRLVEYFDEDPCTQYKYREMAQNASAIEEEITVTGSRADSLGVTIEAEYTVGEYDIQILSAAQSDGLAQWLVANGYKLPEDAEATLGSYIKQNTKFFVAKVNLEEQAQTGLKYLRPLQIAFESPKFQLPIRLGTVNADGKQELFVFGLTRSGRIETTNYRTVNLPTGMDIPVYVKNEFGDFYKSMFQEQVEKENGRAVFMEYAWNMNWCDPCAADPLSAQELRELGVYWLENGSGGAVQPRRPGPQAQDVYVTRLHVSYDAQTFPEDLVFKETGDKSNFQGRYVLRHPYKGDATCEAAEVYRANLPERFEKEAQTLANLTGWEIEDIRKKMNDGSQNFSPPQPEPWWKRLWGDDGGKG
ncbi:DUF2330 domain-containing protein [Hyphococcus sp.]|uniref:DUF2330 domain-containing protein n=1 Tax=Hyphococcus sp. TaxID=2038636 RepID=UPI003CCC13C2